MREALQAGDMATLKKIIPVLFWIAGLQVKDFNPDEQIPPGWRVIESTQVRQLAIKEAQLPTYAVNVTPDGISVQSKGDVPLTQTIKTASPTVARAFGRTLSHAAELAAAPLLTANRQQLTDDSKLVDIKDEGYNRGSATLVTTEREPSGWIGESKTEKREKVRIIKSRHSGWQIDTGTYTQETDGRGRPIFKHVQWTGRSGKRRVGTAERKMIGSHGWNYKEQVNVIEIDDRVQIWDGSANINDFGPREALRGLAEIGYDAIMQKIRDRNSPREVFTDLSGPHVYCITIDKPYRFGPLARLRDPNADFGWTFYKYEGDDTVYGINFLELQRTGVIDQYNKAKGATAIEKLKNAGLANHTYYKTEDENFWRILQRSFDA